MSDEGHSHLLRKERSPIRLGVVSFLNALPLIDGLETLRDVELKHFVPSRLLDQLLGDHVDVALCSSIDYQRAESPLVILPAGLLGCDGSTLTVRLYSTQPFGELKNIYCDSDSHTSVALLRILLREMYEIDPDLIDYDAREHLANDSPIEQPDAVLLIGDKVVTDAPNRKVYPHQLDLGDAWAKHTDLPFVFALWMSRESADAVLVNTANAVLDRLRRQNRDRIRSIVHLHASSKRWTPSLALDYLSKHMSYELTDARLAGLEVFYDKALEHGIISTRRPVNLATLEGSLVP